MRSKLSLIVFHRVIIHLAASLTGPAIDSDTFPFPALLTDPSLYGGKQVDITLGFRITACPRQQVDIEMVSRYTNLLIARRFEKNIDSVSL